MRNPTVRGGASINAKFGRSQARFSAIAAPRQAPPWRPVADIFGDLLRTIAQRAIVYHYARGDLHEVAAIRRSARRAGALPRPAAAHSVRERR